MTAGPFDNMGDLSTQHIGLPKKYFEERNIWLDCRSPGMITIDADARFGYGVKIITESHDTIDFDKVVARPTTIEAKAWIASFAILYNCHIETGAIVAVGTVVRSQRVKSWTMVAGNPARVIAKFYDGQWNYDKRYEILE